MMASPTGRLPTMRWAGIVARRLERHHLARPSPGDPASVVRTMCGAHAQMLSAAELSVALRLDGGTRSDVQHALWEDHALVKTFGPRGTVHLLAADDLWWWTAALATVPPTARQAPGVRLDRAQTDEVVAAIGAALADADLTADELGEAVIAAVGPWAAEETMPAFGGFWPRWRQALHEPATARVLCFGPNRGRKVTYTSPARWIEGFEPADDPSAALATLVAAYLHSFGPATPTQFARWLAAPAPWATGVFADLADEGRIEAVRITGAPTGDGSGDDGDGAWVNAGDTDTPTRTRGVRLLGHFDSYTVGSHPRSLVFPGAAADRALTNGQAGNMSVVLVDGIARGVWHQKRSGRRVAITVELFDELTAARSTALERQVEHIGEILDATPTLTLGPVTVGPHA